MGKARDGVKELEEKQAALNKELVLKARLLEMQFFKKLGMHSEAEDSVAAKIGFESFDATTHGRAGLQVDRDAIRITTAHDVNINNAHRGKRLRVAQRKNSKTQKI